MRGRRAITICSLFLIFLCFLYLMVMHELHVNDQYSINFKINSLVSFGRNDSWTGGFTRLVSDRSKFNTTTVSLGLSTEPPSHEFTSGTKQTFIDRNQVLDWPKIISAYQAKVEIYLDWNIDSSQFTYMHYKSLESAFVAYPKATFQLL